MSLAPVSSKVPVKLGRLPTSVFPRPASSTAVTNREASGLLLIALISPLIEVSLPGLLLTRTVMRLPSTSTSGLAGPPALARSSTIVVARPAGPGSAAMNRTRASPPVPRSEVAVAALAPRSVTDVPGGTLVPSGNRVAPATE